MNYTEKPIESKTDKEETQIPEEAKRSVQLQPAEVDSDETSSKTVKKKKKKASKKKSVVKKVFLVLLVVFLSVATVFMGINYAKFSKMTTLDKNVNAVLDEPPVKGKMNLLLLGVDEGGKRSDTIMIISVDNVNKTIKLLSIPRDTKITLSNGQVIKMNACIGFERAEEFVIETVKTITKMPIHYYCQVNFDGFKEIIDVLGGVNYNVPFDMNYDDPAQDLHIHLKKGLQHLDGQAAHDFVRFRHNNESEAVYAPGDYYKGDIGRIGAQQDFLKELFRQKMQMKYLVKAPELLDVAYEYVHTNFTISSAMEFISMLRTAETTELETFILPGTDRYENKISYYIYSPSETKKLVLEEFGYPEEEAKKLAESKKQAKPSSSAMPEISASPAANATSDAEESASPSTAVPEETATKAENTRVPAEEID